MTPLARTFPAALCAASLFASPALAQVDPAVTNNARRDLIRQAQEARVRGDHAAAVDFATRAGQLSMNLALRRFLAEEQLAAGQLGPALESAQRCLSDGDRDASPAREQHLAACRALQTSLGLRVGRVRVDATPIDGMVVRVADEEVGPSEWGTPRVVTPGAVLVTATAPGRRPFHSVVDVAAGVTVAVRVSFDGSAERTPPARTVARTPTAADVRGPLNPGPLVLLGIGGAGLVATGIFYALRGSALNAQEAQCDDSGCPEAARADHDRAVTYNTLTNVAAVVGGAFAVGGLVWYLVVPRRAATETRVAGPWLAPSQGGAVLGWQGTL